MGLEEAGLALLLEPVGLALDDDAHGAVQQAVQGRAGESGITPEDLALFAECSVRGEHEA